MSFAPGDLSNFFTERAAQAQLSPRPAATLPAQYRDPKFAITHMMDSLHELGGQNHDANHRLSKDEVEAFADAIGGEGHGDGYQAKMAGVRQTILSLAGDDGTMTIRDFAQAMALGGRTIPAGAPLASDLVNVAGHALAGFGVSRAQDFEYGLAKVGDAVAREAYELNPAARQPQRRSMAPRELIAA